LKKGQGPDHVLLFANPQSQTTRSHHTIQVSFDDGRTWPAANHLLLDEGRGRGYPSISRIDDDHIGIVYEGSRADLTFEKIALDELLRK
jgi:sialidase-1